VAVDPAQIEALAPDDILNRMYVGKAPGDGLNLFIAYYKTQHRARNAHDPKLCLPGSGWEPQISKVVRVPRQSVENGSSFPVNYYVIRKGEELAVILYWFQTFDAVRTKMQGLHLLRVRDTLFNQRSDMALVRIATPVLDDDLQKSAERALRFAGIAEAHSARYFPPAAN
jgi:EpsI family protein